MVGPTFGHVAATVTGLLLVEKLCMDHLIPPCTPVVQFAMARFGRFGMMLLQGTAVAAVGFWGVGGLLMLPAFCRCKKWKIQEEKEIDFQALTRALPLIVLNFIIGSLLVPFMLVHLLPEEAFDFAQLPGASQLAFEVPVWLLLEELMFFYCHRWMHRSTYMYQAVHKLHHTWVTPAAWVAIHCHPVEHVICNILPLTLGPIVCGSHIAAIGILIFVGMVHTTAVHSGYWLCDDNGMHDVHHSKFNVNFGVLGLMDRWYGTYVPAGASGSPQPGLKDS